MGLEQPNTMQIMDRSSDPASGDLQMIKTPLPSDILCGKNKYCLDHPGSVDFRFVIEQNAQRYQEADSKYMKMEITKQLYKQICQQSVRFLKYNSKAKGWQELTSSQVRDKIGHALRFANRRKRRNQGSKKHCSQMRVAASHRRSRSASLCDSDSVSTQSTASESDSETREPFGNFNGTPNAFALGHDVSKPVDEECLPVTRILRNLSKSLLDKIPRSISCADGSWQLKPQRNESFGMGELSDRDVMCMLREPVMEFEPKSVQPVWL